MFAKPQIVQSSEPSITVYPNPISNGIINLQFNNMAQGNYKIKIVNNLGQAILTKEINHTQNTATEAIRLGKAVKGTYNVEVITPGNTKISKKIISY